MSLALAWPDVLDVPQDIYRYARTPGICCRCRMSVEVGYAGI